MANPPPKRSIYLLSPKTYGAETIAVAFAKTSRSPLSFKDIAEELTEAQASQFHEKWVVGYGHASVAEHAVLHLAFENVSRLAVECLQSNRLASYTEKSTRYQQWDLNGYCCPPELDGNPLLSVYQDTCRKLFLSYTEWIEEAVSHLKQMDPVDTDEPMKVRERRLRSRAVDAARFLLPAASLANVGMTVNARALAHALRKMLSHPLAEVREIGEEALDVARLEAPTLVRHVEPVTFLTGSRTFQIESAEGFPPAAPAPVGVTLQAFQPDAEEELLAAMLFREGIVAWDVARRHAAGLSPEERGRMLHGWLGTRGRYDALPREVEQVIYSFEVVLDQGAYYELKRHRMMTQLPQPLTASLGYEVPQLLKSIGACGRYRAVMDQTADAYQQLAGWNADVAGYVVPNGFRRRMLLTANLRQLCHFCELRATSNAHFSMREIAHRIAGHIQEVHPHLGALLRMPEDESAESIARHHFVRGL